MGRLDDEDPFEKAPRAAATLHTTGEALDAMSVAELDERIELLRLEIARLEEARAAREATRKAADAFFKP